MFVSKNHLKLWIKALFSYSFLLFLIIIISPIIGEFDFNKDNSRYMLSALIQSEAAIIAIVITFSLVAVQYSASKYSARVIDVFKFKNPDFWILLIVYIGSMIYEIRVLLQVDEVYDPIFETPFLYNISTNYDPVFWSYNFGIFSFFALMLYMFNTFNLLKPTEIIKILAEDITETNIFTAINSIPYSDEDFRTPFRHNVLSINYPLFDIGDKDPILPIIDIISSSLTNSDTYTSKRGLNIIKIKIIYLINHKELIPFSDYDFKFSKYIEIQFLTIVRLVRVKKDEDFLYDASEFFYRIFKASIEKNLMILLDLSSSSLYYVGNIAVETKMELAFYNIRAKIVGIQIAYKNKIAEGVPSELRNNFDELSLKNSVNLRKLTEDAREKTDFNLPAFF